MEKSFRNILINSTLIFVSAFIITTFIHELGHYLSYLLFGANPTLFHNYVQVPDQPLRIHVRIISALAGPVISLVQGIVFGVIVKKKQENTASHLFYLWLSLLGYVNFFGYLVVTPLSTTGDTGEVAELLNIDYSVRIATGILGFAILLWIILKIARNFSNYIPVEHEMEKRRKYVYRIMFFPIIIGSIVNALLAFPVVAFISLIYPATSSFVIMSSFGVILKSPRPQVTSSELETKIIKPLILLVLGVILLNRLLVLGVG